ncbi:50S ribosomal protein L3 N(5)-glutamine methyltransferase [Pseudoalteromonas luteoviolacea]|uniref:Ribosomal protein uL3 glutamine methyltransferase n=1 Tax=Pseudoalteromonas luteoviolacea S4054 TaxID=1129367 RepID=A0A0F6AFV5_9GAMM|nr:50S ribosomal protein L3 N(5)-glutamine methyltransferase [Pseudoalteromonas luteoviolacea]AOT09206.1 ribosomal protein L3 N(5)-glutamine methyltransferase [Pseudoalteromonas luteoviolacea]AOT14118.1 ribosomal protein L3 N(5)-glutamine methyltransferase [Pseudoalteromonas luteoviolacea]AOT19034.1 ribosomal protein L3 N(5)-glutamine methyltransferase [Pseudoalteromonas luteoviolacea]KKE85090.1 N5-glutamine S-adenosyl-L-methionine-dependent methyltransferase [Pseudoalteromonas luteoviolacea S4
MSELAITNEIAQEAYEDLVTMQDWLRWTTSQFVANGLFYGHGTDNPWDEAVNLLLPTLNLPIDAPKDLMQARLTGTEKKRLIAVIKLRIEQRMPVPYLTNQAWFAGMPFYVDERVLVPRSPFAELITQQFQPWVQAPEEVTRILDMCTGSACIAIALAKHFENAQVDAVDISFDALAVAEMNIHDHMMDDRVFAIQSDVFSGVPGQKYDLIVANPPYVDAEDMADLPDEFHHEPELGLASGDDGLDVTRVLLQDAAEHLTENGILFVEVGNSMVHMEALYPNAPFTWLEFEHGGLGVFMISKKELVAYFND